MGGVGGKGLFSISSAFVDAVRNVIALYGNPKSEWPDDWQGPAMDATSYSNITVKPDKLRLLSTDRNLIFIQSCFDGDLTQVNPKTLDPKP